MAPTRQGGFTLVELLIVVTLVGVLAALSAPFLIAAKAAANEASAVGSLKAVNSGQLAFSTSCASGTFSSTIANLIANRYVDQDIALAPKSGFLVALAPGLGSRPGVADCGGNVTVTGYYVSAVPVGQPTARRAFATSQQGVIWEDVTGVAPAEPFTANATTRPIQ
jgi:prepilin-type N-terminal cleavage/methylation domain-containing protein